MRTIVALAAVVVFAAGAAAQQWGTVKGQIVWGGGAIPKREEENVTADKNHCLSKGKLLKDDLLIDAKSLGVKDVFIWLGPVGQGPMPIHPGLKAVPAKPVEIDQPCCHFEPRAVALRSGQTLIIKNSSPVAHNSMLSTKAEINPSINNQIPAGGQLQLKGDKALMSQGKPIKLSCSAHGWMSGWVGVFDHPYFAITDQDGNFEIKDAPAGGFVIFVWHERNGWLHQGGKNGQNINIPPDKPLDLGKIAMK
jgi:hypothetical protein